MTECVWLTHHYLRLYIYGFAFQAHVHRATSDFNSDDGIEGPCLFPAGLTASPDAKHILEAIDAAVSSRSGFLMLRKLVADPHSFPALPHFLTRRPTSFASSLIAYILVAPFPSCHGGSS